MPSRYLYVLAFIFSLATNMAESSNYLYEKHILNGSVVHVVTLHPRTYNIKLIKSNDGKMGRENVPSMAKRTKAEIAINAGFFEIGGTLDGKASGTLIIDGKKYNVKKPIQSLLILDKGSLSIKRAKPSDYDLTHISMVSGIPFLIKGGALNPDLTKNKSDFFTKPHARTAIGTKADGTILLVVTDILSDHSKPGLTLKNLAQFMKKLGCHDALNLDGGGSSTLWIGHKVVNQTIGDADEHNGLHIVRKVSDALVFIPK